jgi:hypothetical protein
LKQKLYNFLVVFALVIFLTQISKEKKSLQGPVVKIKKVHKTLPKQYSFSAYDLNIPKEGEAEEISLEQYIRADQLTKLNPKRRYGYGILDRHHKQLFAYIKPSTKDEMFFVNGYLNGFVPYNVQNIWMPLKYLQTRLKYQSDEVGYNNRKEVWQTAKESYIKLRGDCEDHAILLADWLIGLGYDARVVVGKVKFAGRLGGHAWVILLKDGQEYLLEATKKSKWNILPLAKSLPYYFPKFMFNRKDFWVNTGSVITTEYLDAKWKKSGKFIPDNPFYKDLYEDI